MIEFSLNKDKTASFKYRRWAEFVAAWLFGVPITIGYFSILILLLFIDRDFRIQTMILFLVIIITAFPFAVMVTNAVHLPVLNSIGIFTEIRTLICKPREEVVFRLGFYPFCISKTIPVQSIEKVELIRHRYGKGLGFFYYWTSLGKLHSLRLVTREGKHYYLAVNEEKNGLLSDEGRKLSEFIDRSFVESY